MGSPGHLTRKEIALVAFPPALFGTIAAVVLLTAEEPWVHIAEGRPRSWVVYLFHPAIWGAIGILWIACFRHVARRVHGSVEDKE